MAKKLKVSRTIKAGGMEFDGVAIGAAVLVYMALGFIWYSKALFFPEWSKQTGLIVPGEMKMEWYAILGMLAAAILFAIGLSRAIKSMNLKGFTGGMLAGVAMAVCYLFMANSGKWFFAGKPALFWIDFGYQSIAAVLMGGVIGMLQNRKQ
jgi:multisubunit Na+/H+ antiporter MnhB subunit